MLEYFICCLDLRNWNPFQFSPSFSKCHLQTWFLKIPTELLSFFCTIPLSLECSLQIPLVLLPNMVSLLGLGLGSCLGPTTLWYYPLVLEKEMATHSSTLAWKIPRTEEPGKLQSMGSQSWTPPSDKNTHTHTHDGAFPVAQWLKKSACNEEASSDYGWIPGSGSSLGGGDGNPL